MLPVGWVTATDLLRNIVCLLVGMAKMSWMGTKYDDSGMIIILKFPLAPMGVLAPVSAHAGPSAQPPIGTSGNFPARVSAESISPNFPIFRSKYG